MHISHFCNRGSFKKLQFQQVHFAILKTSTFCLSKRKLQQKNPVFSTTTTKINQRKKKHMKFKTDAYFHNKVCFAKISVLKPYFDTFVWRKPNLYFFRHNIFYILVQSNSSEFWFKYKNTTLKINSLK